MSSHRRTSALTAAVALAFSVVSCDTSTEPRPVFEIVDECADNAGCVAAVRYQGRKYESTGIVSEDEVPAEAAVPAELRDMERVVRVHESGRRLYLSTAPDQWARFHLVPSTTDSP